MSAVRGRWSGWASALAGGAWLLAQAVADRWTWSQWVFWIPGWAAAAAALLALAVLRVRGSRGVAGSLGAAAAWATVAVGTIRLAKDDLGWGWPGAPPEGAVSVTHWNARWPGQAALESGRSLARELGDVAVISSPGSMLRGTVAEAWMPDGYARHDLGIFGIVSRWPVTRARMLGSLAVGSHGTIWLGWFEVSLPSGDRLSILAVDLPSDPLLARGAVATSLRELLAASPPPEEPDIIVGDLNCTPGSVTVAELPQGPRPAPPWRCVGWLGTYPSRFPVLRIDTMRVGGRWRWARYSVAETSASQHLIQRGWMVPRGGAE
jgi:hypothetical protein